MGDVAAGDVPPATPSLADALKASLVAARAVWANPVPLACTCTLPSETDDIGSTCPACRSAEADGRGAADSGGA